MNAPVALAPIDRAQARIGPNSVLQLVPLLDDALGSDERERLMRLSGLERLPSDDGLMAEGPAAALHQILRAEHPRVAPIMTRQAGERTGDYIIQHRIPVAALRVLRRLPPWLAGHLLARIIERHSWTFAGSGEFRIANRDPLVFELRDNPVVRGERATKPICHWHAAVFERLFTQIVDENLRCIEHQCCAMGADSCIFEIS
ncbi:MAG: bacteriochlorophyll 4-vinyl reductase [Pseudomonadota bacterium]